MKLILVEMMLTGKVTKASYVHQKTDKVQGNRYITKEMERNCRSQAPEKSQIDGMSLRPEKRRMEFTISKREGGRSYS